MGIVKLTHGDYLAHSAIGSSDIKMARKSLAHFKASKDGLMAPKTSQSLNLGTAAHSAILEQDYSKFVEGPDVNKNTKVWKEFVKEHVEQGKIVLDPKQYETVKAMYNAFWQHPKTPKIITGGAPEVSILWTPEFCDQELKARLDYYVPDDEKGDIIIDLKTARDASFGEFQRATYNYRYDLSAVHYIDAVETGLGRKVSTFVWAVQENDAPYTTCVYIASADLLRRAKEQWIMTLKDIDQAVKADKFPHYNQEIVDLDLPAWAVSKESEL